MAENEYWVLKIRGVRPFFLRWFIPIFPYIFALIFIGPYPPTYSAPTIFRVSQRVSMRTRFTLKIFTRFLGHSVVPLRIPLQK
ncbi:hypothetical protein Xhom_02522 [Xenorhabdus hominickii]|uniref:Uncharacterized protein n=1 Tax=Xenorhabdus hominickii TaxID=351679 RepID=A0A2G0Q5S9_XENHO|nr:hypothetical protein Xhom_02522 [Xenorhabdus hominickii]